MRINRLFGEDIDITQEDFGKKVREILSEAKKSDEFSLFKESTPMDVVVYLMNDYRSMLEKREIDENALQKDLIAIIDICVREGSVWLETSYKDTYEHLTEVLIKKNADYGNASIKNGGSVGNYVRMTDKLSRLRNFLHLDKLPNYESLADTWLDMAGYATLGVIILQLTQEKLSKDASNSK